jgi:hypothetical protein
MISQKLCPAFFLENLANIWAIRLFSGHCDIGSYHALKVNDLLSASSFPS